MAKKCKDSSSCGSTSLFLLMLLFLGTTIGAIGNDFFEKDSFDPSQTIVRQGGKNFVAVESLTEDFLVQLGEGNSVVVADGKTWIPVEGSPIHLTVLNDATCTSGCETAQQLQTIRSQVTPALLIETVDISSEDGQKMIEDFELKTVPQFIFGEGAANFEKAGVKVFDTLKTQGIITEKDGKLLLDGAKVGFPSGKFLQDPEFDNADDPVVGDGPVTVIEFSDYQCPFSKRLHDQNKDLLTELVEAGRIKYVFKDFPLSFHAEAPAAHKAANCVLKEADSATYLKMKDKIFASQSEWGGKGDGAKEIFTGLASELEVDISSCIDDESIQTEITADMKEGGGYGVTGTPGLFIGKQKISGAISPDMFREAVEKEEGKPEEKAEEVEAPVETAE